MFEIFRNLEVVMKGRIFEDAKKWFSQNFDFFF